jgi:hypothetical protein
MSTDPPMPLQSTATDFDCFHWLSIEARVADVLSTVLPSKALGISHDHVVSRRVSAACTAPALPDPSV